MSLADAALSAVLQAALLGGVPFFGSVIYQRWRHKRTFRDSAGRAGLQLGEPRYILYSLVFALLVVAILVIWTPPLEPLTRKGSAQHQFVGLGLGFPAIAAGLLNGAV